MCHRTMKNLFKPCGMRQQILWLIESEAASIRERDYPFSLSFGADCLETGNGVTPPEFIKKKRGANRNIDDNVY